jgi:hypothetical protein
MELKMADIFISFINEEERKAKAVQLFLKEKFEKQDTFCRQMNGRYLLASSGWNGSNANWSPPRRLCCF